MGTPSAAVAAPVQSLRHPLAQACSGSRFTTGLIDAVSYPASDTSSRRT